MREFDAAHELLTFTGGDIGTALRDFATASRVTQIRANSLTYDFTPHVASADLVLVDAGHGYEHGVSDTNAALRIVRPGGIILWDDFEPFWHELVHGICDAMEGRRLGWLAGTSLGVYVHEE